MTNYAKLEASLRSVAICIVNEIVVFVDNCQGTYIMAHHNAGRFAQELLRVNRPHLAVLSLH